MSTENPPPSGRVEAVPCTRRGAVDVRHPRYPDDVLHLTAAEWAEFASAVKAGTFDHLPGPVYRGGTGSTMASRPP
jgi:hypothetical protein